MKLFTFFLPLFLGWTAAATVIQDRVAKTNKITGQTRKCEVDLIKASKQGVAKITIPKPPAKGKKVARWFNSLTSLNTIRELLTRDEKKASGNEVVTGTASDSVETFGLGTCTGIIVIFEGVTDGKVDKIAAHVGFEDPQSVISELVNQIYSAASEGRGWDPNLDAGHQPHVFVSYPNVDGEIADMVRNNVITSAGAPSMRQTLTNLNNEIQRNLNVLCSQLNGQCYITRRTHTLSVGGKIKAETNGVVTADGQPFQ